ncbi:MAG: hypothetical protein HQL57_03200 [Magnetococcales bacterium]|nr:hypothetical protein [Magnetococcales bacterium]
MRGDRLGDRRGGRTGTGRGWPLFRAVSGVPSWHGPGGAGVGLSTGVEGLI